MRTQNLAIVFTDVKGFAETAARATLEQNQAQLASLHGVLDPVFRAFHGRVVKAVSDSFLVVFESPTLAVLAAQAAQDEVWKHNASKQPAEQLQLRAAVSAGEVTLQANDVLGEPVAAAAAVRDSTPPGEVSLTEAVWLVVNHAEVKAEPSGRHGEQAVFRVPRSGSGAPFGGQGMAKAPPVPTGEVGPALTASALKAIKSPRNARLLLVAVAALVAVAVVVFGAKQAAVVVGPPPLQRAIDEVRTAPTSQRSPKVVAAQALIAQEQEAGVRDYWYGKLQAVQDDPNAAAYFRSSIRAGHVPAEAGLIELLQHRKCDVRIQAIDAIVGLKLMKAREALIVLSEKGGPDDTEKVLFFGCNSRQSASEAVDRLDRGE